MTPQFDAAMRRALESTRAQRPQEATAIIQQALAGMAAPAGGTPAAQASQRPPAARFSLIDPAADAAAPSDAGDPGAEQAPPAAGGLRRPRAGLPFSVVDGAGRPDGGRAAMRRSHRAPRSLRAVIDSLGQRPVGLQGLPTLRAPSAPPVVPDGARYETRSFASAEGSRAYRLYVPASLPEDRAGLIVMLHGCTQTPDDFAAGTRMNSVAEEHGLIVAYPEQTRAHNASACWNWFRPGDQRTGAGEPAVIAGLTLAVAEEFGLDRARIFVAGLSAGGAMAAVLAEAYPDLYAAVGIHSGLPCGSASDVASAFAAMRGESGWSPGPSPDRSAATVRTIVFHGAADRTVHPSNGEKIIGRLRTGSGRVETAEHQAPGGRSYTRSILHGPRGEVAAESWVIGGAGHAWSGGDPAGSYTDPAGPDASAEMVRFFLALPAEGSA